MSSSESLTIEEAAIASKPPTGWTDDKPSLCIDYYWLGEKDDLRYSLDKYYHIAGAVPIWTRESRFGDVMFIFKGRPTDGNPKQTYRYYVWNGIEDSVVLFSLEDLGKIQTAIKDHGKGKGYLGGLKQTLLKPVE